MRRCKPDEVSVQVVARAVTGGHTILSFFFRNAFRSPSKDRPWVWPTTGFKRYPTTDRSEVRFHRAWPRIPRTQRRRCDRIPQRRLGWTGDVPLPADFLAIAGFATSTIVKVIAFAGAVVAFYKYAPSSSDDNIITRYISSNATPSEVWERTNTKHTILEQQQADGSQILWSAQKPPVHRYRYPQCVRFPTSYLDQC